MLGTPAARLAVVLVIVASIGGAVFRVATAPDRVRERRETARAACASGGGEWIRVGADEICRAGRPNSADPDKK